HEIHAERRGATVDRRRERGVDHRLYRPPCLAGGREAFEVDARQVRVGRRLADDEARLRPKRVGERGAVAGSQEGVLDAAATEQLGDELERHPVAIAKEDDVLAAACEREHRGRHGGHSAGEKYSVLGTLEGSDALLDRPYGRITVATVLAAFGV